MDAQYAYSHHLHTRVSGAVFLVAHHTAKTPVGPHPSPCLHGGLFYLECTLLGIFCHGVFIVAIDFQFFASPLKHLLSNVS